MHVFRLARHAVGLKNVNIVFFFKRISLCQVLQVTGDWQARSSTTTEGIHYYLF
jgi:hypothetical protein